MIGKILSIPWVFELQQKLCNNYDGIRDHFAEYLTVRDRDILEVGCSTGTCASIAVPMRDNRYIGIDIVPQYIELARKRHPHGRFLTMDARQMSFPEASFDVILFVGALHHMADDVVHSCFQGIRRVLRDDGVVLCAEPVFTRGKHLSTVLLHLDRGRHIRTEEGYRRLFAGFQLIRQSHFRFSLHRFCSFVLKKPSAACAA